MHIGLIGGIGVAATVAYYQKLTAAVVAKGQHLDLTIVHADVQELLRNNREDDRQAQAQAYATLINRLKVAGCDCAAITSLGGHFCFDETVPLASLPLVSAVTPLDDFFSDQGLGTVGLLGTRVVMQTQLYGQLRKTRAVTPGDTLETVGQTYLDMAVSGSCTEDQRNLFVEAGQRMVDDMGANAIVLAGTDLNLAFDGIDPGYRVIDALDVHVDLLARLAMDKTDLPA